MSGKKISCAAWGLTAAALMWAAFSPGCQSQHINWKENLWRELFPAAEGYRQAPLPADLADKTHLYVVENHAETMGYLVEKQVNGRSGPFEILVVIDFEGRVKQALVLNYPHERGRQVLYSRFTRQFAGKGPHDPIRLDEDINAISGATISSQAMTDGVREVVALVRSMFVDSEGLQP